MSANFEQLQSAVLAKLLSEELLQTVNIKSLRKMQIASELDLTLIWTTPRNGKSGAGLLIGMPTMEYLVPNVPGPERKMLLPISVFENPTQNMDSASGGTLLTAEEIADFVDALLARFQIEGLAALYTTRQTPNTGTPGVIRYDLIVIAEVPRAALPAVPTPDYFCPAQTVTLTNQTGFEGAAIYFTTDNTFPGRDPVTGNPIGTAARYTGPFTVASGGIVNWCAYQPGYAGSDMAQITVS